MKTSIEVMVPNLKNPTRIVTIILASCQYSIDRVTRPDKHGDSPDKLVSPVSNQFDTASTCPLDIEEIASQFYSAELPNYDGHSLTQRVAKDLWVESGL